MNVEQSELNYALTFCARGIKSKTIIPVHANIVCDVKNNVMYMRGINQETGFYTSLYVDSSQDVSFAVSGQDFKNLIGKLSGNLDITPDLIKHRLIVKHSNGKYEIAMEDPKDYPNYDSSDCEEVVTFTGEEFISAVNAAKSVIVPDDLRPVFSSVNMDIQQDNITFVGTDSHRLVMTEHIEGQPKENVSLLLSLDVASHIPSMGGSEITVKSNSGLVVLESSNKRIVQVKQEGHYPAYRSVVPTEFSQEAKLDKNTLQAILSRIVSVSNISHVVNMSFQNNNLVITASDIEFGRSGEEKMTYEGHANITIGFNGIFLAGLLRNINSKEVTFKMSEPSRAAIIQGEDNMTSLIMPLMINN